MWQIAQGTQAQGSRRPGKRAPSALRLHAQRAPPVGLRGNGSLARQSAQTRCYTGLARPHPSSPTRATNFTTSKAKPTLETVAKYLWAKRAVLVARPTGAAGATSAHGNARRRSRTRASARSRAGGGTENSAMSGNSVLCIYSNVLCKHAAGATTCGCCPQQTRGSPRAQTGAATQMEALPPSHRPHTWSRGA